VSEPDLRGTEAHTAFFDRLAGNWSQSHYGPQGGMLPRIARFAEALADLVPAPAGILDYGCGTGDIAAALAARGYRVDARDMSPKMIDQARTLHAASGVRFAVVEPANTRADLSLGERAFDAILCSSVLEYVRNLPETLHSLASALKPGGWLLATVPNIHHPLRRTEAAQRAMMRSAFMRSLVRVTPWRATFETQWLSHNRLPVSDWAALLRDAQLRPVWRDCRDHPLTLLLGQRSL
jgi:2-polyprenyl-3-methyl-5-hydroxy-6-metoxy-1,4-benzoquinol methylase